MHILVHIFFEWLHKVLHLSAWQIVGGFFLFIFAIGLIDWLNDDGKKDPKLPR